MDLGGLGQLLAGIGTLIVAIVALRTQRTVKAIDKAVNTKPPGSQSISEQVSDLAARLPAQDVAAAKVIEDNTP